jgi:hypothetical protein
VLEYCDYIADRIYDSLFQDSKTPDTYLGAVGKVRLDLKYPEGWLVSSKKTMTVTDANGQKYKVTVEAIG